MGVEWFNHHYTRGRDQVDEALSRKSGVGVLFCRHLSEPGLLLSPISGATFFNAFTYSRQASCGTLQPMAPEQWEAVLRRSKLVPSEKAKQSKMVRVRVLKAPKWLRRIRGMPGQPTQDASNYLALTKLHEPLVNNMFSGRAARGARREQETRVITTRWPSGRKPGQ